MCTAPVADFIVISYLYLYFQISYAHLFFLVLFINFLFWFPHLVVLYRASLISVSDTSAP